MSRLDLAANEVRKHRRFEMSQNPILGFDNDNRYAKLPHREGNFHSKKATTNNDHTPGSCRSLSDGF